MFSITNGQEKHLLNLLHDKGISKDELTTLLNEGYLSALLESSKQGQLPGIRSFRCAIGTAYQVLVEAEMLHSDFARLRAEDFPDVPVDPYTVTIELLFPRREVTTDEMVKHMGKKFRPVSFLELVALGIQYPKAQASGHIVGLVENPTYDHDFGMGYPVVLTSMNKGSTYLTIVNGIHLWNSECRFAAVRL